jgi:hypothetical protein
MLADLRVRRLASGDALPPERRKGLLTRLDTADCRPRRRHGPARPRDREPHCVRGRNRGDAGAVNRATSPLPLR